MDDKVFVYGTLKRGLSNFPLIEKLVRSIEPGFIEGTLYDLGEYPAVMAGSRPVYGELLTFACPAEALSIMDQLEDYYGPDDPRNEYDRSTVTVQLSNGTEQSAYCYFYTRNSLLQETGTLLPDGYWPPANSQGAR